MAIDSMGIETARVTGVLNKVIWQLASVHWLGQISVKVTLEVREVPCEKPLLSHMWHFCQVVTGSHFPLCLHLYCTCVKRSVAEAVHWGGNQAWKWRAVKGILEWAALRYGKLLSTAHCGGMLLLQWFMKTLAMNCRFVMQSCDMESLMLARESWLPALNFTSYACWKKGVVYISLKFIMYRMLSGVFIFPVWEPTVSSRAWLAVKYWSAAEERWEEVTNFGLAV